MDDACSLGRLSAAAEARGLLPLLEENTVEQIKDLVRVPPNIEKRLREFAAVYPEEQRMIAQVLKFRAAVLQAFEKLVATGAAPADAFGTEETEPVPPSEAGEMVLNA